MPLLSIIETYHYIKWDREWHEVANQPVLIDQASSIIDVNAIEPTADKKPSIFNKLIPRNSVAPYIALQLADAVARNPKIRPLILVIGGGTIGSGLEKLYDDPRLDIISFDVYPSKHTQFVADAHNIPLESASVNAVIIQAVLEHVLNPQKVVNEIQRVLLPGGLVYADTPFLQHVHEGPYDFTRFTESGHRWLFRNFGVIEAGQVAGVGTQFAWSCAQLARSLIPIRGVSTLVRLAMTPFAMFVDKFANKKHSIDGASSVYFYGYCADKSISPKSMIEYYSGAQQKPIRV